MGNLEEYKPVKLNPHERNIPDEELFYGNRRWGRGSNREFFVMNQGFDFMNGMDDDDMVASGDDYYILSEF